MEKTLTFSGTMTDMAEITSFLNKQVEERGWSISEFARRVGVSQTLASDVLNGKSEPSAKFVISAAGALDLDPVWLLRMAEILPDIPPSVQEEEEVVRILRGLPPQQRSFLITVVRGLAGSPAAPKPSEPADRQQPQRETVQLDHTTLRVVEYIYRSYGEEPPEGCDIPVTADLVRLLLRQIVEFYNVMRPFLQAETRHSPEKRERARQLSDEERQGEPCRD